MSNNSRRAGMDFVGILKTASELVFKKLKV